jgi:uncharacterized protein YukE
MAQMTSAGADLYAEIPGDPAAIHAAAESMARASTGPGQRMLEELDSGRARAMASWRAPASDACQAWFDRARGPTVRLADIGADATRPYQDFADELAHAQRKHAQAMRDAVAAHARGTAAVDGSPEHHQAQADLDAAALGHAAEQAASRAPGLDR